MTVAFIAISSAMPIPPNVVVAIVINPKFSYLLLHSFRKYNRFGTHSTFTKLVNDSLFGCVFNPISIPLPAGASLPWRSAKIAKTGTTPAGNVKTSLTQLYNGMTAGACLPVFCESESSYFKDGFIFATCFICVSCVLAG
jgi:hypothetical protein